MTFVVIIGVVEVFVVIVFVDVVARRISGCALNASFCGIYV